MIIMGIDPGLASTGVGVIRATGAGEFEAVFSAHVTTSEKEAMPERLQKIFDLVRGTIDAHAPGAVSIESVFFAKNVRSAVLMSHGRGAAILAAAQSRVAVIEYSPLEIKQSVVGKGQASKEQVKQMVSVLLALKNPPRSDHETDALAAALCHAYRSKAALIRSVKGRGAGGTDAAVQERKELLALSLARGGRKRRRR